MPPDRSPRVPIKNIPAAGTNEDSGVRLPSSATWNELAKPATSATKRSLPSGLRYMVTSSSPFAGTGMVNNDCKASAAVSCHIESIDGEGAPSLRPKTWSPLQFASTEPGNPKLPMKGEPGTVVRLLSAAMENMAVPLSKPFRATAANLPSPVTFIFDLRRRWKPGNCHRCRIRQTE